MSYDKQTWQDGRNGGTPLTADRLNHIENGIDGIDTRVTANESEIAGRLSDDTLGAAFVAAVTPQAFGAVTGNVVDCTTAINDALATQQAVLIPEGDYKISGTIHCNRNGVILTTGRVRLIVTAGATLSPMLDAEGAATGKTVVFDHALLDRGVVHPISVVGNGAAGSVAFGSSHTDGTVEPNNTFIKPDATGCEWAVWGDYGLTAVAGSVTGHHYIDLSSSCANGVCVQQNQDDVTFSGSTRIRSVTGVAVRKTAGVSLDMGNVYIGLQDGATGVDLGNYANGIVFGNLFIEAEPGATTVTPIVMDGIGISTPRVTASLTVTGRLSVNAPDGTSWITMLGRYDHLYLGSAANLDYNGARPNSKLVELVYGDQQDTHQTGTINYDGDYDARVIARPAQPWPWQLADTSTFNIAANDSALGVQRGVKFYAYGDIAEVALIPLLINAAAGVATRDPLAQRGIGKVVRLEGAINKTNAAEDAVVASLPVGYRPITSRTYPIAGVAGGVVAVRSDGVITVSPTATTGTISLDGITYQAV